MRRSRLGVFGSLFVSLGVVVCVWAGVAVAAVNVPAGPSATATRELVGSPTSVTACGGTVSVHVTVTGGGASTGTATDVMLTLDLSGSMVGTKLTALKSSAQTVLDALDAADGHLDSTIANNRVGIVTYNNAASVALPLGSSYTALTSFITGLSTASGGSRHDLAVSTANGALVAPGGNASKAMVLITDGLTPTDATAQATAAKNGVPPTKIVSIGIGSDASSSNLTAWASPGVTYQSGSSGSINTATLIGDIGALKIVPANFSLTETMGANFTASGASAGTVAPDSKSIVLTGSVTDGSPVSLTYTATRNSTDVFSVTMETVSTGALVVTGGTATVTPTALSIDVLPCGGTPLAPPVKCTGSSCTTSGSQGGVQYSLNAGTPAAGTDLFLTGFSTPPPAGVCPGFDAKTNGVQFDVRPLTTDATFRMVIPKAALGSKKWWQTDVCIGTNLKFTTEIGSFANLRPGAKKVDGGTLPARWWGLLPTIPRYTFIQGLGWVKGPWITNRSQDAAGNAVITFKIPYIAGAEAFTTDGKAAYDPKCWG